MVKGHAMVGGKSIAEDGFTMFAGGVAFVLFPIVEGIFVSDAHHVFVAVCFCEDRGSCNRGVGCISFDDTLIRNVEIGSKSVAVDKEQLRFDG